MPNLTEMERRNYEQRLARLEDIALRLSGELFMEGADPHSAKRLHHNLEVVETEIELLCEAPESQRERFRLSLPLRHRAHNKKRCPEPQLSAAHAGDNLRGDA